MARDFSKNLSNYMDLGLDAINPLISGASVISVHARINLDSTTTGGTDNRIINIFIDAGNSGIFMSISHTDGVNRFIRVGARSVTGDSLQSRIGTTDLALSTWHSVGGVVNIGGDAITPYQNGAADNGGAVTFGNATYTTGTPTGNDMIGANTTPASLTTAAQVDGRIAEVAIWTVDIGASGFESLADGASPLMIRPDGLVLYMPLIGNNSPETDIISAKTGTITGTIAKADHPRIYYPSNYQLAPFSAGGAPATAVKDIIGGMGIIAFPR